MHCSMKEWVGKGRACISLAAAGGRLLPRDSIWRYCTNLCEYPVPFVPFNCRGATKASSSRVVLIIACNLRHATGAAVKRSLWRFADPSGPEPSPVNARARRCPWVPEAPLNLLRDGWFLGTGRVAPRLASGGGRRQGTNHKVRSACSSHDFWGLSYLSTWPSVTQAGTRRSLLTQLLSLPFTEPVQDWSLQLPSQKRIGVVGSPRSEPVPLIWRTR